MTKREIKASEKSRITKKIVFLFWATEWMNSLQSLYGYKIIHFTRLNKVLKAEKNYNRKS